METNWAAEHLQVIRTLMERSSIYRRALAPVMLVSGFVGLAGAGAAYFLPTATSRSFTLHWMVVGLVTLTAASLLVRRQALKDSDPFWSLPTQRVAAGLFSGFFTGLVVGLAALTQPALWPTWLLAALWALCYGGALRAAGFFMERGIKLFGSIFLAAGALILLSGGYCPWLTRPLAGHVLMGATFGFLHLAYGVYLYFTERKPAA
jgi:hypothetical protein